MYSVETTRTCFVSLLQKRVCSDSMPAALEIGCVERSSLAVAGTYVVKCEYRSCDAVCFLL